MIFLFCIHFYHLMPSKFIASFTCYVHFSYSVHFFLSFFSSASHRRKIYKTMLHLHFYFCFHEVCFRYLFLKVKNSKNTTCSYERVHNIFALNEFMLVWISFYFQRCQQLFWVTIIALRFEKREIHEIFTWKLARICCEVIKSKLSVDKMFQMEFFAVGAWSFFI